MTVSRQEAVFIYQEIAKLAETMTKAVGGDAAIAVYSCFEAGLHIAQVHGGFRRRDDLFAALREVIDIMEAYKTIFPDKETVQ